MSGQGVAVVQVFEGGDGARGLSAAQAALRVHLANPAERARTLRVAAAALRLAPGAWEARALVADVEGDTWTGALSWDPAASMVTHIIGALRARAARSRRAASSLIPLDAVADGELAAPDDNSSELEHQIARLARVLPVLRQHLATDAVASHLLALFEAGHCTRSAAMAHGISSADYHNGRRRIVWHARAIDTDPPVSALNDVCAVNDAHRVAADNPMCMVARSDMTGAFPVPPVQ